MTTSRRGRWLIAWPLLMLTLAAAACAGEDDVDATGDAPQTRAAGSREATPSPGCANPDASFATLGENGKFESGGEQRVFSIDVPPDADPTEPLPLVVNLHGALGTRQAHENKTGLGALGRREGFITLTPQARGNEEGLVGRPIWDVNLPSPDVEFVDELVTEAEARLCVDSSRLYLTGFSMGAMLSQVVACSNPDRYAAVAPVAGIIDTVACTGVEGIALVAFHSTADEDVRFDGTLDPNVERVAGSQAGPPRDQIAAEWATRNGCGGPDQRRIGEDVEAAEFRCDRGEAVTFYSVLGAGHTWPGSAQDEQWGAATGLKTTQTIDATALMWEFFRAQSA